MAQLDTLIGRAIKAGNVEVAGTTAVGARAFRLTPAGRQAAARLVRAHRLWELFLIEQARIAPDHVDRDADAIEHVLPEHVIADLERQLIAQGRLPRELMLDMPASPHAIARASSAGVSA